MDELESEGRLYRKTKCGWVDSGSCRVNDAIARRLDKVFYGKESSSASIKELFTRAKQANQMQDYPNAERICLEILKQKGLPQEEAQGAIAMLFSALRAQSSSAGTSLQIIKLAEGFALQFGSCVLVGPAGISLKSQEAFEGARENAILGRDCFWRAMSGRSFNPYSSNLFHRMKALCDELGIEISKKAENRWNDQSFSE